jgi:hypothetical protein
MLRITSNAPSRQSLLSSYARRGRLETLSTVESLEEDDYFDKDRWDEGGRSDCGYSDTIHDTLMTLGGWMHRIFGEPSHEMSAHMEGIGNNFQEASYAVRDFSRGTIGYGAFYAVRDFRRSGTIQKEKFDFKADDLEGIAFQ